MDDRHIASIMTGFTAVTYTLMKLLIESEALDEQRVLSALDALKEKAREDGTPATAIPIDHLLRMFAGGVERRSLLKDAATRPDRFDA